MTKQHRHEPYRGYYLDFALYGIDIKNSEKKLDAAVRSCDYIANLIAVCSVQTYYLIVADFLKVSRHLRSAFAGLVGVIWSVRYSGAETWTS